MDSKCCLTFVQMSHFCWWQNFFLVNFVLLHFRAVHFRAKQNFTQKRTARFVTMRTSPPVTQPVYTFRHEGEGGSSPMPKCVFKYNRNYLGFNKPGTKQPRLRCHTEVTSDQTMPDESNLWSDHPRPKYPLIRLKCARNTVCAPSALETVSDQTFPGVKDLWSEQNQTIVQTIVRSKPLLIRLLCVQKSLLIRLLCAQNHLWSDSIALEIVWSVNGFHYERILV